MLSLADAEKNFNHEHLTTLVATPVRVQGFQVKIFQLGDHQLQISSNSRTLQQRSSRYKFDFAYKTTPLKIVQRGTSGAFRPFTRTTRGSKVKFDDDVTYSA